MKNLNKFIVVFLFFFICLTGGADRAAAGVTEDYPTVKLRSLDKITAHTETFEAAVGSTVKFGSLFIKVQACRKTPPVEMPEAAAFLQIWEVSAQDDASWVFSGWMFASSPGLSSMDHAIYDVWVLDCLGDRIGAAAEGTLPAPVTGEEEIIRENLDAGDEGVSLEAPPKPEKPLE